MISIWSQVLYVVGMMHFRQVDACRAALGKGQTRKYKVYSELMHRSRVLDRYVRIRDCAQRSTYSWVRFVYRAMLGSGCGT